MSEYENGLGLSDKEIKRLILDALENVTPEELYRDSFEYIDYAKIINDSAEGKLSGEKFGGAFARAGFALGIDFALRNFRRERVEVPEE